MSDVSQGSAAQAGLLAALGIPTRGRVIKLGLSLSNDKPIWPAHGPFLHYNLLSYLQGGRLVSGNAANPALGMLIDRVEMPLHAGTHVDALNHIAIDDVLHDGTKASDAETGAGARVLGVETIAPFIHSAVLLDIASLHGVTVLPGDQEVTPQDIEGAMQRQDIASLPRGGIVVIHTGWMSLYETQRRQYFEREPGIGVAVARMLADAGVRGVAGDNSALELVPASDPERPYPVHQELLARRGVHIFENLVTSELAAESAGEFLFVAVPLDIRGATASPVIPLAIL